MSASELLRKAAATLRERAGSAGRSDPAPWTREAETGWHVAPVLNAEGQYIFTGDDGYVCGEASTETAAYIATMGPDLGLTLADWLDDAAARRYHTPTPPDHALIVARLIVGEQS